ncbi:MAG: ABC transporter substrate-binding protein [Anaerovoracaceae bacterium]|jgi:multiple sugar transport system substrate-binding protein
MNRPKFKKFLAMALILILALSALTACGGGDGDGEPTGEGEPVTITFATSVYVEEPHQVALDALLDAFNEEHPEINVEIYGAGYADYWDNVTTEIMGGNEADIMQVYPENVASYNALREGGVFEDLTPYMGDVDYKSLLTGQDMCEFDGKTLAFSNYAWGNTALFYRKSILEEVNIDPESIKTWDDFVNASKILKDNGYFGMGVVNSSHSFVVSEWARMLARPVSKGLYFPNGEAGPYTADAIQVNSPENVWAAQQWQDYLLTNGYGKAAPDKKDSREYFWNGLAAFCYDGPWFVGMCEQYDPDMMDDIGIIPAPSIVYEGTTYAPNPTMYPLVTCMSNKSENKEAAWTFMEWMASEEAQKIAAQCGMIPANTNYSTSEEYKNDYALSSVFADLLELYEPQVSDPLIPQQGELNQTMINATQQIFAAGEDAQAVLDKAAEDCKAIMNK